MSLARSYNAPQANPLPRPAVFSWRALWQLVRIPNLLMLALSQYLAAIFLLGPKTDWLSYLQHPKLFMLVLATLFITAAGYLINDYYDTKIDFINRPQQVVVGKSLKRRSVLAVHTLLNLMGVALGLAVSPLIGALCLLASFWLWLYSVQLKRRPFIGNLSVAGLTALSICLPAFYFSGNALLVYTFALFAFSLSLVREIVKDMEDVAGDAAFGCRTLPIVLGLRATKLILYFLIALFAVLLVGMAVQLKALAPKLFFLGMLLPIMFWVRALQQADTRLAFGRLSLYCKLMMLAGVLSMVFF